MNPKDLLPCKAFTIKERLNKPCRVSYSLAVLCDFKNYMYIWENVCLKHKNKTHVILWRATDIAAFALDALPAVGLHCGHHHRCELQTCWVAYGRERRRREDNLCPTFTLGIDQTWPCNQNKPNKVMILNWCKANTKFLHLDSKKKR